MRHGARRNSDEEDDNKRRVSYPAVQFMLSAHVKAIQFQLEDRRSGVPFRSNASKKVCPVSSFVVRMWNDGYRKCVDATDHMTTGTAAQVRPLLRWAGSKRSAMAHILRQMPEKFANYIEPFAGSAALHFTLNPQSSVIADLNRDLISFYGILRSNPAELYTRFIAIPRERESYLSVREAFKDETDPLLRATQFIYLNRNCFNGLYRTNKAGHFNVPFSAQGQAKYPTMSDFQRSSSHLRNTKLICADFRWVIDQHVQENDIVYLDPPYLKQQGRIFSEYVRGHFCDADLDGLLESLREIDRRGAKFIMSFIDDPIVDRIREQWNCTYYEVQRNIAGFAGARKKTPEILLKNW